LCQLLSSDVTNLHALVLVTWLLNDVTLVLVTE